MICPHCARDLKQKERTGHVCSLCHREFALDPKVEPGRLHDRKLRELAGKLTEGGLTVTVEQLYWANERRLYRYPSASERQGKLSTAVTLAVLAALALVLGLAVGLPLVVPLAFVAVVLTTLSVRNLKRARTLRPDYPMRPWVSPDAFRDQVLGRWRQVHRELPPQVVEHVAPRGKPGLVKPRAAVLCKPAEVRMFLQANDFEARQSVLLVEHEREVPDGVPVVVLRDLSLAGLAEVLDARAAFPGRRVVDAGLPPRAVLPPAKAIRQRDDHGRVIDRVAAAPAFQRLTEQERAWLLGGWHSRLITLPPAKLMALARKGVERALAPAPVVEESPAATRRRAEQVGFLTWPEAIPSQRPAADAPTAPRTDGRA
ncbi:hypothetical protein AB0K51_33875 [Kitasatospora sp. NPDC049285]|uniref:hypothetical protein n=1 Tax=Kitasatospora sp. NPDC049285 TaxID=3157096 RepID=UPI003415AD8C